MKTIPLPLILAALGALIAGFLYVKRRARRPRVTGGYTTAGQSAPQVVAPPPPDTPIEQEIQFQITAIEPRWHADQVIEFVVRVDIGNPHQLVYSLGWNYNRETPVFSIERRIYSPIIGDALDGPVTAAVVEWIAQNQTSR